MIATACGLDVVPWWGWLIGVACVVAGTWIFWRAVNAEARRFIVATVTALMIAGIIYAPNCREDFWRGICGSYWCLCAQAAGCDVECGEPLPEGAVALPNGTTITIIR